jgi:hypothetical protein
MEKKTEVNYRIFYSLFLILLSLNQNFSQEANVKTKKRIPISYTEEEIKNFPQIPEKPNKKIKHLTADCSNGYACDFDIYVDPDDSFNRQKLFINEIYPLFWERNENEAIERGKKLKTKYFEYFTRVMNFDFNNKDFRLEYETIIQRRERKSPYPQENYEDLRDKTYILEPRIMNLYPSKIKILDYIEFNDKPGYYFLILARPSEQEYNGIAYEVFISVAVTKNNNPKILYSKKISYSTQIWYSRFYGLMEKSIQDNRVIIFNQTDYLSNGPESFNSLHLVRVGKVNKK